MCGFVGELDAGGAAPPRESLERVGAALRTLSHRGPDHSGLVLLGAGGGDSLFDGEGAPLRPLPPAGGEPGRREDHAGGPARTGAGPTLAVGHNRLAIVDHSAAGHQPMLTADGRFLLVFNGEIYNHVELRAELAALGHRFRSRSDTEVLLEAFSRWGRGCLHRLTGMFAFAAVDRIEGRLFLARDPFGMKPLFLLASPGRLAFASEIPALLRLMPSAPRAHPGALLDYLEEGLTDHRSETMLEPITALPAAHFLEVSLDRPAAASPACYWNPRIARDRSIPPGQAAERLRALFLQSVRIHLRSDAPVGALLSGGIDSSSVVMGMRHAAGPGLQLHTFSYIGGQGAPSEEPWIDQVNEASGAIPHKVRLRPAELTEDLERLVTAQGEPFSSLAIYAQHRLYREAAAAGIKVILDGQGGDEVFAGYSSMWPEHLASLLRRGRLAAAARFLRGVASGGIPGAPGAIRTLRNSLPRVLPGAHSLARFLRGDRRRPWVSREWCRREDPRPFVSPLPPGGGPLSRATWRALRRTSLPGLLRFGDRNSMAWSLEGRMPFLTAPLVELALSLPEEHLIASDASGKSVVRAAMRGIVPGPVLDRRRKIGFAVPNGTWLTLVPVAGDLLEEALEIPAVHRPALESLSRRLRRGVPVPEPEAFIAWRLIGLAAWARQFHVAFT